jgi:hypothetical protein
MKTIYEGESLTKGRREEKKRMKIRWTDIGNENDDRIRIGSR